jgi:sacsin
MAQSQGPALWAFNDAVFTDKDFENINKLAGGTKIEDLSKIGRFGLGFNAVYHLTDVPSFISRNFLCVFDPNVNHISNHIREKSRPGIRINLAKNPRPLTAFADQFAPYDQVFGCKTTVKNGEKFHFEGTLFRFSFRTESEAKKSEICETVYDSSKVKEIVGTLQRSATLILLFTQNVTNVELHELDPTGNPQNTSLILSIKKEIQRTNTIPTNTDSSYIKQCSKWWQNELLQLHEAPSLLEQVKIVATENPSLITGVETSLVDSRNWLVAYCTGKDRSIEFAGEEGKKDGLLPLAAAAAELEADLNDNMTTKQVAGEAFCFLPLSISTGLRIHVNSSFAVRSNRDGIWEKTTAEENLETRWNECLLQDAIPEAYFKLLFGMVDQSKKGSLIQFDKQFHDLWPRLAEGRSWKTLVSSFYTKLVQRDLKLFNSNEEWLSITGGYILDNELRRHQDDKVVKTLRSLDIHVFDLPSDVIDAMKTVVDSSVTAVLGEQTLSLVSFFEHFLFPNLHSIPADLRNPIVHRGLGYIFLQSVEDWQKLESLYEETECIPCSPDGQKLARPCDLIDPNAETIAALYSPEENRFPSGELDNSQLSALRKLGMVYDLLSWQEICDRAESIEDLALNDKEKALKRSRFLIKYLRCNIERLKDKQGMSGSDRLQEIQFLPVLRDPPARYELPWKGAEFDAIEFRCPNDLFLPKDVNLIGSSCLIVDTDEKSGCGSLQVLEKLLGFTQRRPSCEQVLQQLEITRDSVADGDVKNTVCQRVYKHLNNELDCNQDHSVIEKLKSITWMFVHEKFVENRKVALQWKGYAEPFLYEVPDNYQQEFKNLLKLTVIKKKFTPDDFLEALDSLKELKGDSPLTPDEIKLVVTSLINELKDNFSNSVKQRVGTIPLPDTKGVLSNSIARKKKREIW